MGNSRSLFIAIIFAIVLVSSSISEESRALPIEEGGSKEVGFIDY